VGNTVFVAVGSDVTAIFVIKGAEMGHVDTGCSVGEVTGTTLGTEVGEVVTGCSVEELTWTTVGAEVGDWVCESVSSTVGKVVGTEVGTEVTPAKHARASSQAQNNALSTH